MVFFFCFVVDAFSILSNVNLNDLPDTFPDACKETIGPGEEEAVDTDCTAFQMVSSSYFSDICYRVGGEFSVQKSSDGVSAGLIDPVKPASGWYLQYTGGNTCKDSYTSKDLCPSTYHSKGTTYCQRSLKFPSFLSFLFFFSFLSFLSFLSFAFPFLSLFVSFLL